MFPKIVLLQSWSKSLKNKESKSSFFSIVVGPMLETLTLKPNSFTSIFFSRFSKAKAEQQYCVDQLFGEDVFWNIYGGSKTFKKLCYRKMHTKGAKNLFKKIFNFHSI